MNIVILLLIPSLTSQQVAELMTYAIPLYTLRLKRRTYYSKIFNERHPLCTQEQ